jgi:hypothetical protein
MEWCLVKHRDNFTFTLPHPIFSIIMVKRCCEELPTFFPAFGFDFSFIPSYSFLCVCSETLWETRHRVRQVRSGIHNKLTVVSEKLPKSERHLPPQSATVRAVCLLYFFLTAVRNPDIA